MFRRELPALIVFAFFSVLSPGASGFFVSLDERYMGALDTSKTVVVGSIRFEGNQITRENILRREMTFSEGDTLQLHELSKECEVSSSLLFNTRLFNFVEYTIAELVPGEIEVVFKLVERWYWWPQLLLELADPNFNTWWQTRDPMRINYGFELYRQNFRGSNQDLKVRCKTGYTKEFGLSYRIPFFSRNQQVGLQLGWSYREQDEITIGTRNNQREFYLEPGNPGRTEQIANVEITYRPGLFVKYTGSIAYVHTQVRDSLAEYNPDYLANGESFIRYLKLFYSMQVEKRDNRAYPLRGYFIQTDISQRGMGLINTDGLGVFEMAASLKAYFPLPLEHCYFAAGLRLKAVPTANIPYYVQEGLGYGSYLRGYEYFVVDGQQLALLRSNLKYELLGKREFNLGFGPEKFSRVHTALWLNIFADAGKVWDRYYAAENPLSNRWLGSVGVGLDLVTYYDRVFRLEWAINKFRKPGVYLHFVQPI
jgi:outer membrane protein assembly factor BamA